LGARVFDQIVGHANDVVMVAEVFPGQQRYHITYINNAFTQLFGYPESEIIGQSPRILNGPATLQSTIDEISQAIHKGERVRRRILNYAKNGRPIWMEVNIVPLAGDNGRFTHFAAIERDVTDQVRREEELNTLATTDPLTNLNNRRAFDRQMGQEIEHAMEHESGLSLAAIDLDFFKSVNDRYGHDSGDEVLVAFARKLSASFTSADCVARVGGEEFSVLVPDSSLKIAQLAVDRMRRRFKDEVINLKCGDAIHMTCSIGVTEFRPFQDSASSFSKRADAALYEAKRGGRDRVVVLGLDAGEQTASVA
jgi:diguanylate cyclase (GGDEF)-like protein/PAS domain S-box-containing protein